MRMIDRNFEIETIAARRPASTFVASVRTVASGFFRAWRNRRMVNRLNELEDHQLLDMGLRRSDVSAVRAASFFSDAGLHLTLASRERARRHLRAGRSD